MQRIVFAMHPEMSITMTNVLVLWLASNHSVGDERAAQTIKRVLSVFFIALSHPGASRRPLLILMGMNTRATWFESRRVNVLDEMENETCCAVIH